MSEDLGSEQSVELEPDDIPDPTAVISDIRNKLKQGCAVLLSKWCNLIICKRLQGATFKEIEEMLCEKGLEFRISAPTIWRNMAQAGVDKTDYRWTEIVEAWGGEKDVNIQDELRSQIIMQKTRINALVKREADLRKADDKYMDRRVRGEMETYVLLLKSLFETSIEDGAIAKGEKLGKEMEIDAESEKIIEEMILKGALRPTATNQETFH